MKAVQINGYSKRIHTLLRDMPRPQISDSEVLIEVKAAAVNPLEILILEARSQAFRKEIGSSGHTDIASPNPNGRIARCHPGGRRKP